MSKKYKVNELAKNLNIQPNEIIELLSTVDSVPKKTTTGLDETEVSIVLNHFTKENSVNDFKEYFAILETKPTQAAKAEKTEKVAKNTKTDKNTKTEQQPKTVQNDKKQQPKANDKKVENKADNKQANKPAQKTEDKKPNQNNNNNQNKNNNNNQNNNNKTQPKDSNQGNNALQPNRHKSMTQTKEFYENAQPAARAPKPVNKPNTNNNNNRPSNAYKPTANDNEAKVTQSEEKVIKHVDTRTVDVNLDKYNQHYEDIAPTVSKRNENFQKKQKLNQRSQQRQRQKFSNKKETEAQKLQRLQLERARKQQLKVLIPEEIVVVELAARLKITVSEVIKKLMGLGVMATQTETIDFDTASLVAEELGAKVEKEVVVTVEERLIDDSEDHDDALESRNPVVVVMGHVDHGKTSLLDKIRDADVTAGEAGGITQHIGAYTVTVGGNSVTFLDTPGHEAFTSMRARGASVTDIAILVVAADDGIMPQTIEAINHAKAAGVSIIVAINKMDKEAANPDKVMQSLTEYDLVPEAWGGDVICCPVSAITGQGIEELLEQVSLVAEVAELKANPNRLAKGTVIEARLDKGRGPVATLLVQNGTLKTGDIIIAGACVGRVRVMTNDKGIVLEEAGPSMPVEITGLAEVPQGGDIFNAVEDERMARTLVDQRKHDQKEEVFRQYQKVTLDNLFSQIELGEIKTLPIIVKADVQGSAEAVKQSLEKLSDDEVRVRVIHNGVGAVSKSDVMLAQASGAIIIGFNVRPDQNVRDTIADDDVEIRLYRIIYDAIEDVKDAMKGMLDPKIREVELGRAEVRQVYKITNVGVVAGCYVIEGKVARNALIRVVRDGIVLAEDKIDSLKRFKDDQKEVATGYECGIGLDKFHTIKEGDIFESFILEEYRD